MSDNFGFAIGVCIAHEQRRRMPLPPLDVLAEDEALRIVRAEEARRAGERLNWIIEAARTP